MTAPTLDPQLPVDSADQLEPERNNQTFFAEEEPLLEVPQAPEVPMPPSTAPQPNTKLKVLAGVLVVLLCVVALLVVFRPAPATPEATPLPTIAAFNPSRPDHPLQQRIDRLELQLKEADPARQDIVFPTVETVLELDPEK